jgi:transposase
MAEAGRLQQRRVLITGAASGIGRRTAALRHGRRCADTTRPQHGTTRGGRSRDRRTRRSEANRRSATLVFCWANWRRQWFDIAKSPPAPTATEALKRIAEIYAIEGEICGHGADARRAVRQQKTKPLAEALRAWLEKTLAQVASGSAIAQAIRYALNRWDGLVCFLDGGRIEIDSNTVERAMRPIALSRKNALFAGSDEGAENWAMLASLIETCKLHDVNPEAYPTDVLTGLVNNWPNSRVAELTPWRWSTEH